MGGLGWVWSFLSPLRARLRGTALVVATACRSSHRAHATAPADRDRAPRRLPRALRAAYGALNKSSEGGLLLRSTSATPLQQLEGFKREATIVSAEIDDERRPLLSPVLGRAAAARCRVGGALPMTNIRLTVKHGCSHAQPCSGASLGTPLPPRCRGRGALFDLGYYLASGGRRRRGRGGGELPVANTRLTVQDGGSRPQPCTSMPL